MKAEPKKKQNKNPKLQHIWCWRYLKDGSFFFESGDERWHEEACRYFSPASLPSLVSDLLARHLKWAPGSIVSP